MPFLVLTLTGYSFSYNIQLQVKKADRLMRKKNAQRRQLRSHIDTQLKVEHSTFTTHR